MRIPLHVHIYNKCTQHIFRHHQLRHRCTSFSFSIMLSSLILLCRAAILLQPDSFGSSAMYETQSEGMALSAIVFRLFPRDLSKTSSSPFINYAFITILTTKISLTKCVNYHNPEFCFVLAALPLPNAVLMPVGFTAVMNQSRITHRTQ